MSQRTAPSRILSAAITRRSVALAAIGMWLTGVSAAMAMPPAARTPEAVVRQFWDAFNRGAWGELDALVQPNYVHHPPGKSLTLAQFKQGGAFVHTAFADYRLTIEELVVAGDTVAVRWTATGRHVGSFFGEAPTGRAVAVQGMHFHHIRDGRIADDVELIDFAGLRAQLTTP